MPVALKIRRLVLKSAIKNALRRSMIIVENMSILGVPWMSFVTAISANCMIPNGAPKKDLLLAQLGLLASMRPVLRTVRRIERPAMMSLRAGRTVMMS